MCWPDVLCTAFMVTVLRSVCTQAGILVFMFLGTVWCFLTLRVCHVCCLCAPMPPSGSELASCLSRSIQQSYHAVQEQFLAQARELLLQDSQHTDSVVVGQPLPLDAEFLKRVKENRTQVRGSIILVTFRVGKPAGRCISCASTDFEYCSLSQSHAGLGCCGAVWCGVVRLWNTSLTAMLWWVVDCCRTLFHAGLGAVGPSLRLGHSWPCAGDWLLPHQQHSTANGDAH